jgi:VWFA-related protein
MPIARSARAGITWIALTLAATMQAQQQVPDLPRPTFGTSSTAIVVDVIVRDTHGKPLTDLAASDFELLEDGVPQQIGDVSIVLPGESAPTRRTSTNTSANTSAATAAASGAPGPAAASGAAPAAAGAPAVPLIERTGIVALVFDRLSPENRGDAFKAAQRYVDSLPAPIDFTGVFFLDLSLRTVQTYTNDRARLRTALDSASRLAASSFRIEAPTDAETAGSAASAASPGPSGAFARMTERSNREIEHLARNQEGYASVNGLAAAVSALAVLPGRKTVVFLSEGLSISGEVLHLFEDLETAATRANVTIYALDCAGLRVRSSQMETAHLLNQLGLQAAENGANLRDLERNEDILRLDPRVMLDRLARNTGGFLVNNTNDLGAGLRRIDADRRFHYVLTYAPLNPAMDGRFRRIEVRVHRLGVEVHARDGYLAVPQMVSIPLLWNEAAAVSALTEKPRPTAIPIRARVLQFFEDARDSQLALVVDVPRRGVVHRVDAAGQTFQTDFTILARLLDASGNVVRKASEPYRLFGPASGVEPARRGHVLFYRQPTVSPGRYTFEYAVYDALGKTAGAGAQTVDVLAATHDRLAMSSVIVVGRAEQVPDDQRDAKNPLYVDNVLLSPNLSEPLRKSADVALAFFYVLYPHGAPVTARLEVAAADRVLARVPLTLPASDASGRIAHLAKFPLTNLPPGSYELRVIASDGTTHLTRTAAFTLVP